jgi:hypothetical protein
LKANIAAASEFLRADFRVPSGRTHGDDVIGIWFGDLILAGIVGDGVGRLPSGVGVRPLRAGADADFSIGYGFAIGAADNAGDLRPGNRRRGLREIDSPRLWGREAAHDLHGRHRSADDE